MLAFDLDLPRHISFGPGARAILADAIGETETRVLLVSGSRWLERSPWKPEIDEILGSRTTLWVACRPGEPTVSSVDAVLAEARRFGPDVIVGVGGGSVLDTAKAVAGLTPAQWPVMDYLEGIGKGRHLDGPGIPFVAMPTTSGTGAEATRNAVVKSPEHGVKKSLRSPHLMAGHVIVDPELTLGLPPDITGNTGMDALVQLIESYLSRKSNRVTRALAASALAGHLDGLERLASDPTDLEARTAVAYGSLMSGMALANSGLGAAHGFASSLGGVTSLPHGLICAVMIAPVLRANAPAIGEQVRRMHVQAFGGEDPGPEATNRLLQRIVRIMGLFDIPRQLPAGSVEPADIPGIAARSTGSSMSGNPVDLDQTAREDILGQVVPGVGPA